MGTPPTSNLGQPSPLLTGQHVEAPRRSTQPPRDDSCRLTHSSALTAPWRGVWQPRGEEHRSRGGSSGWYEVKRKISEDLPCSRSTSWCLFMWAETWTPRKPQQSQRDHQGLHSSMQKCSFLSLTTSHPAITLISSALATSDYSLSQNTHCCLTYLKKTNKNTTNEQQKNVNTKATQSIHRWGKPQQHSRTQLCKDTGASFYSALPPATRLPPAAHRATTWTAAEAGM